MLWSSAVVINTNVQIVVAAINEAIGANGTTVDWSSPLLTRQGIDSEMSSLVSDLDAGKIGALFVYGANPAYTYHDAEKFKSAIKKAKVTVSFNDRLDETSELCKFVIPAPHFLESWGDAEPRAGYISMMQPTIAPLFKTRPFEDSLLKWSGNTVTHEDYLKQYWISKWGNLVEYENTLQLGFRTPGATTAAAGTAFNGAKVSEAAAAINSMKKGSGMELVLYQKVGIGVGLQSNNPWLLELPDPITKANWDNYAIVSPKFAKDQWGIDLSDHKQADKFEVHPDRQVVRVK